ncbi:MAG: endonuclease domain-containing protein [Amphiplicatus sp.]
MTGGRAMRRRTGDAGARFWNRVALRALDGLRVRREAPVGRYVVDFLFEEASLVVELDGDQHRTEKGLSHDRARDAVLREHGFEVLRFPNARVREDMDGVLAEVAEAARLRVRVP